MKALVKYLISTSLFLVSAGTIYAQTPTSTPSATATPTPATTTLPDAGVSLPTLILGITAIGLITLGVAFFNQQTHRA